MKTKFILIAAIACMMYPMVSAAQVQAAAGTKFEGSPYLDDNFASGIILLANSNKAVPLRYNIYQDLMEYKQNGQPLVLDPSASIKRVKISNSTFVADKFEFRGKTKYGFLTLLDSGKVMLLSKKVVTFADARKGGNLDGTDAPARFTRSGDIYFYKIGNGELVKVESLKKLIAALPEKQEEVAQFAKTEKISLKREEDLVRLVRYFNSLN